MLTIYEKGIIDIYIDEDKKPYIYGEDIYKLEGAKVYYTTWFKTKKEKLDLKEGIHYKLIEDKLNKTVRRHLLTLEAARKVYLVTRGPKVLDVLKLLDNISMPLKDIEIITEPTTELVIEPVKNDFEVKDPFVQEDYNELYPQIIEQRGQLLKNGLVNIYKDITGSDIIDARELYNFLKVQSKFADWIKNKIIQYNFIENEDYVKIPNKMQSGNTTIEYVITIDMAKELSMLESNEMGKEARLYFIEAEKTLKKQTGPLDINSILKAIIDYNNHTQERIDKCYNQILSVQNQIDNIKLMEQPSRDVDKYKFSSSAIASQLNFYSTSNIPHSLFINSIARTLGYADNSANLQITDFAYKEAQIGRANSIYYTYEAVEGMKKYIADHENMFNIKLDKTQKPIKFMAKLSEDGKTYYFDINKASDTVEYLLEKQNWR